MTSHDHHDLARLAELAASDPRGDEARAMVAECPECAEELRLQVEALGYLGELTTAELSGDERTGLRDGIWTRLQKEPEEKAAPTPTPITPLTPRRSWYPKVVGVAAALVMVVGLGYVLTDGTLTGGPTNSGSPDIATESADEDGGDTTRAAAEPSIATEESLPEGSADNTAAADSADDALGTAGADVAGTDTAANTTVAAGGDTTSAEVAPTAAGASMELDEDLAAAVSETVDRLRNTAPARSTEDLRLTTDEEACIAELAIDRILTVDSITAGDTRLTVVSRRGDRDVVVFDPTSCQEVTLP
ncbi:MAG: hypothetical protein GEU79_03150 [Acidimicrobiia bacterium]|nr:hypothetical protein [Acidimicrobiia bacterium]